MVLSCVYEPSSGMDDPPAAALLLEDVFVSFLVISVISSIIIEDLNEEVFGIYDVVLKLLHKK